MSPVVPELLLVPHEVLDRLFVELDKKNAHFILGLYISTEGGHKEEVLFYALHGAGCREE